MDDEAHMDHHVPKVTLKVRTAICVFLSIRLLCFSCLPHTNQPTNHRIVIIDFTLAPSTISQEIKSYLKETLVCVSIFYDFITFMCVLSPNKRLFTNAGMG